MLFGSTNKDVYMYLSVNGINMNEAFGIVFYFQSPEPEDFRFRLRFSFAKLHLINVERLSKLHKN